MLTFLAALFPIIGSLIVGGWMIVDHMLARREYRIRLRVEPYVTKEHERLRALASSSPGTHHDILDEIARYRSLFLELLGVRPNAPTFTEVQVTLSMTKPVLVRSEVVRQLILLGFASAGVVCLALDGLTKLG